MANISFRKLDSQGNVSKVFNLRQEDVSPERLSMLFRLEKESIDRSLALDTRGMPAPLNTARAVGGFGAQTQMGFAGPNSSFQRINTVCAKDKSYKKSIWRLELRGDILKIVQHIRLCYAKKQHHCQK